MGTGILATVCLSLLLGQNASDGVEYKNERSLRIPVTIREPQRSQIRELMLYVSTDQGRNWRQATSMTPDKAYFVFHALGDGPHWLRVAIVDKQGKQDPDDKAILSPNGPVEMKIMIDTLQPIVRSLQAQRQGDDILVQWDIQEDNFDRDGVRLEYQHKDAPASPWTAVRIPSAPKGQTSFRAGSAAALRLRLTVRDLAKNQSFALAEAPGTITTTAFANTVPPTNETPTLPGTLQLPAGPPAPAVPSVPPRTHQEMPIKLVPPSPAPPEMPPTPRVPMPPPPLSGGALPPAPSGGPPALPVMPLPGVAMPPSIPMPPPSVPTSPVHPPRPTEKLIADSSWPSKPAAPKGPPLPPGGDPRHQAKSSPAGRKPLPELVYVNTHLVTLEYSVKRIGASGVGGIELWLTHSDGESWERYAMARDVQGEEATGRQKRTFEFRDKDDRPFTDGIFGLSLVVKSKAHLGREPRPGDVPDLRIEIDTQPPIAKLWQPAPDPQQPDHVLLKWTAMDKNLGPTPIALEYAAQREGPWLPIKLDLENRGRYAAGEVTGDYSWKVPAEVPVQVYLRLRVRDKAGNESIAATAEPQYVDLLVPEGTLLNVVPAKQN